MKSDLVDAFSEIIAEYKKLLEETLEPQHHKFIEQSPTMIRARKALEQIEEVVVNGEDFPKLPEPEHWYYCCGEAKATDGYSSDQMYDFVKEDRRRFERSYRQLSLPTTMNKDDWAELVGEIAELYGRLLSEKREVHISKGMDRGMTYYISDGIRWAVAELVRRLEKIK